MQNLARRDPTPEEIDEVTAICRQELEAAGIEVFESAIFADGEVPSRAVGQLCMWSFRRSWYYWSAEGPGIPPDIAERLHAKIGHAVRVAGHACAPSPREWFKGFAVGHYHVDSAEGLRALADVLKSIYTEPAATPAAA